MFYWLGFVVITAFLVRGKVQVYPNALLMVAIISALLSYGLIEWAAATGIGSYSDLMQLKVQNRVSTYIMGSYALIASSIIKFILLTIFDNNWKE